MNVREQYEQLEKEILAPCATLAMNSRGRATWEEPCEYRTAFMRDRDRILHSKAFRRLKHKTQVFLSPEGDHYRTRLTHTLEVSQLARTIARALRLNEDLTEAIALAHDLGHTPFGHAGERALREMLPDGFRHYEQSVRVVEKLARKGRGLNLSWEVVNGIDRHTEGEWAATLEGRVVRIADRIAYINHDMDDAKSAGVMSEEDIPKEVREVLGQDRGARLDTLMNSVIAHGTDDLGMDYEVERAFWVLHDTMYEKLYTNPVVKGEESKAVEILKALYVYYVKNPDKLPAEYDSVREEDGVNRAAADYIAAMTDNFATATYEELFIPKGWTFK